VVAGQSVPGLAAGLAWWAAVGFWRPGVRRLPANTTASRTVKTATIGRDIVLLRVRKRRPDQW
jgi:hypothetical protein